MGKTTKKDLLMITLDKAIELYLTTLETEGKSPRYVDWLRTRLRFFSIYIKGEYGEILNSRISPLTMVEVTCGI